MSYRRQIVPLYLHALSGFWAQEHGPVLPAPPEMVGREGDAAENGPETGDRNGAAAPGPGRTRQRRAAGRRHKRPAQPAHRTGRRGDEDAVGPGSFRIGHDRRPRSPTWRREERVVGHTGGARGKLGERERAPRPGEGLRTKRWGAGEVGPPVACLPARLRVCTLPSGRRTVGSRGRLRAQGSPHAGRCRGG